MSPSKRASRSAPSAEHQVGPDTVVTFGYRMLDAEGEEVERTEAGESLSLVFGYGQAAVALESGLEGARANEKRRVQLQPKDAFGPRDPEAFIEVDRGEFSPTIAVGDELEAENEQGELVPLKVVEISDEIVVLDTNHPLAGQRVTLELSVISVRPATSEEIANASIELLAREREASGDVLLPVQNLLKRLPPRGSGGTKGAALC
jgi:FKBP-type peptidyl-prolyl cis-trans isomerase SlyD